MTVAQTLGVVHSLVGNMKIVMEGEGCVRDCFTDIVLSTCLDGKASTDSIRQDLGTYLTPNRYYHPY